MTGEPAASGRQSGRTITVRLPSVDVLGLPFRKFSQLGMLGRGRWLAGLLVLSLVLVVVNGMLYREVQQQHDISRAQQQALESAETRVPSMLSYDYRSLAGDLSIAKGNTTGQFGQDYAKVLDEVVGPNAAKNKVTTQARETGAAVVSGNKSEVVVLIYLTQSTTTASDPAKFSGSRLNVRMTKTNDGWFVSKITPL